MLAVPADSEFVAFQCGAFPSPASDAQGDSPGNPDVDIVGDSTHPAMFRALDATFLYLRMRVDGDPESSPGDLNPKNWGFLIDTDGDFSSFEFLINANGNETPDTITWEENDVQSPPNDPGDGTRTVLASYVPADEHYDSRVSGDGSSFGGDDEFCFVTRRH